VKRLVLLCWFLAGAVYGKDLTGAAYAADYVHMDDTGKSWLGLIGECDAVTGKLNWDATNEQFKCDTDGGGGGGGEANTGSNLGGGLANFSIKVGVDLRFNSFDAADFNLAANLITIDDAKWAKDSELVWSRAGIMLFPLNAGDSVGDDAAGTDWSITGAGTATVRILKSNCADPADTAAGVIRLCNTDRIYWESAPASATEPGIWVETDEVFNFEDRIDVTPAGTTGADIQSLITGACATQACTIHLLATTYTDVCMRINSKDKGIRIIGRGKDITILKPPADADNCAGITSEDQMIQIENSDDVEMAYMTLDGDKENINDETCNAGTPRSPSCNGAITIRGPSAIVSKNTWLHDLKIIDFGGSGIVAAQSDHALIERNDISNMGCHQTDTPCGCGDDPGPCGGWTAAPNIAGIAGRKLDAFGIQVGSTLTTNAVIRNNVITRATKHGIEVFTTGAAAPCDVGSTALDSCYSRDHQILNNTVTTGSEGIVVNGGAHVEIRGNAVNLTGQTNGTGDIGTGIAITGLSRDLVIANNTVTNGQSGGIDIKPISGGNLVVEGNQVSGNCTVTSRPAVQSQSSSATDLARNLRVIDNMVIQNPLCTYALDMIDTGANGVHGSIWLTGGTYDAGTVSAVLLNSHNIFVSGLNVNGALSATANSFGLSMDNDVTGAVTMAGNILNLALSGTLLYNDKDNDRVFDAGEEITTGGSRQYNVSWKSPTVDDDIFVKVSGGAVTLTNLDCVAIGGTIPSAFVVTVNECSVNAAACAGTGGTVTLNALNTDVNDQTWTDAAMADDAWVKFDVTSLTTTPDYAHCRLEYTQP
jgi:hypothetical protein